MAGSGARFASAKSTEHRRWSNRGRWRWARVRDRRLACGARAGWSTQTSVQPALDRRLWARSLALQAGFPHSERDGRRASGPMLHQLEALGRCAASDLDQVSGRSSRGFSCVRPLQALAKRAAPGWRRRLLAEVRWSCGSSAGRCTRYSRPSTGRLAMHLVEATAFALATDLLARQPLRGDRLGRAASETGGAAQARTEAMSPSPAGSGLALVSMSAPCSPGTRLPARGQTWYASGKCACL